MDLRLNGFEQNTTLKGFIDQVFGHDMHPYSMCM